VQGDEIKLMADKIKNTVILVFKIIIGSSVLSMPNR
jgi:hypothetical protein